MAIVVNDPLRSTTNNGLNTCTSMRVYRSLVFSSFLSLSCVRSLLPVFTVFVRWLFRTLVTSLSLNFWKKYPSFPQHSKRLVETASHTSPYISSVLCLIQRTPIAMHTYSFANTCITYTKLGLLSDITRLDRIKIVLQ